MEREEIKRKAIHIGMGLWAFYPLLVTKYYALLICTFFLFLVLFVFREHRFKAAFDAMARKEDYTHGYLMGPLIYILAVMVCVGFYPPYIAAASFSIMAFGDGVATLVGKAAGKHHYPYSEKTVEGSCGFLVCGVVLTVVILSVLTHFMEFEGFDPTLTHISAVALIGSAVGMVVETLPFERMRSGSIVERAFIDDNFFVPVISGLVMSAYVML